MHLKNIAYFADFVSFSPNNKVWKFAITNTLHHLLFNYL